jgi:hypothetical protein
MLVLPNRLITYLVILDAMRTAPVLLGNLASPYAKM